MQSYNTEERMHDIMEAPQLFSWEKSIAIFILAYCSKAVVSSGRKIFLSRCSSSVVSHPKSIPMGPARSFVIAPPRKQHVALQESMIRKLRASRHPMYYLPILNMWTEFATKIYRLHIWGHVLYAHRQIFIQILLGVIV